MLVCAKERLGRLVFVKRGLMLSRGDLQESFSECLQRHRSGSALGKEPVFEAVFEFLPTFVAIGDLSRMLQCLVCGVPEFVKGVFVFVLIPRSTSSKMNDGR